MHRWAKRCRSVVVICNEKIWPFSTVVPRFRSEDYQHAVVYAESFSTNTDIQDIHGRICSFWGACNYRTQRFTHIPSRGWWRKWKWNQFYAQPPPPPLLNVIEYTKKLIHLYTQYGSMLTIFIFPYPLSIIRFAWIDQACGFPSDNQVFFSSSIHTFQSEITLQANQRLAQHLPAVIINHGT